MMPPMTSQDVEAGGDPDDRMRRTEELRQWVARRGRGAMTILQKRTGLTFAAVSRLVKGKGRAVSA